MFLLNPHDKRSKTAAAKAEVVGIAGVDKFHCKDIRSGWYKVKVHEIMLPSVTLPCPNVDDAPPPDHTSARERHGDSVAREEYEER